MQPRLTRSNTDVTISGVCGGLGEYFGVDSIIVRLIFVLVTLTWGIGLPVYIVLWVLMPKRTGQGTGVSSAPANGNPDNQQTSHRRVEQGPRPQSGPYLYNPQTGQPFQQSVPSTGETIKLDPTTMSDPSIDPSRDPARSQQVNPATPHHASPVRGNTYPSYQAPHRAVERRQQNWRKLGIIFVGLGGLMLLSQLGIKMALIVPPLLIIGGILLLKRGS